ncbi:MAG: His/Gly/Thr/Pro-type tRNA ligase C-terminal domain-containing protein, partial [Ignavibacteriae bacterium]|nr:His/Gly/Thr/Pro-type tRNA ligase C-terminal domain-containing protein [Ignavibacteriota bacterium]
IKITKAIEVGHIFKLGTKYAEALHAYYLDKEGVEHPIVMGSYGIGVERIAAAYIEQNHDDKGIIWGGEISPFKIHLICANGQNEILVNETDKIYDLLCNEKKIDVFYDDRKEVRPGFKFNDADLIGIPIHIIIGEKNFKNGNIEIKIRRTGERILVSQGNLFGKISDLINEY